MVLAEAKNSGPEEPLRYLGIAMVQEQSRVLRLEHDML